MSLSGIGRYAENLDRLMKSEAFKNADDGERLRLGYRLLNSRYGLGSPIGWLCGRNRPVKTLGPVGSDKP